MIKIGDDSSFQHRDLKFRVSVIVNGQARDIIFSKKLSIEMGLKNFLSMWEKDGFLLYTPIGWPPQILLYKNLLNIELV